MARDCSALTLYGLNFLLFAVSVALLAFPWVSCAEYCNVNASSIQSLRFVFVTEVVGGALLLFSLIGCCLARSGKKRFRFPYLLVLLVAAVAGVAVYFWDHDLLRTKVETYDPDAPEKVDQAISGLASSAMTAFYDDFASIVTAADCSVDPSSVHCQSCQPMEAALQTCIQDWPAHDPAAAKYLAKCSAHFESHDNDCGHACTQVFCECAGSLQQVVVEYTGYVKYFLLGASILLGLLILATICVSRRVVEVEEPAGASVVVLQGRNLQRQPMLA